MTEPERTIQSRKTILRRYGMTPADYKRMLADQNGCCAICGTEARHHLHVDHDHTTGLVRGLLCRGCNNALGNVNDSIERLESAIRYLRHHAGKSSASANGASIPNELGEGSVVSSAVHRVGAVLGSPATVKMCE